MIWTKNDTNRLADLLTQAAIDETPAELLEFSAAEVESILIEKIENVEEEDGGIQVCGVGILEAVHQIWGIEQSHSYPIRFECTLDTEWLVASHEIVVDTGKFMGEDDNGGQ